MTPKEIKDFTNIEIGKSKKKNICEPGDYDCKICQVYLHNVGYIDSVDN